MENTLGGKVNIFGQLLKFGLVGVLGTISNLIIFYLMSDLGGINPTVTSIAAFAVAVTQNYLLNHLWTFRTEHGGEGLSYKRFLKFVFVSLGGLAVNLVILYLILRFWPDIPFRTIAQAGGILCGMGVNFLGSKVFVFRKRPDSSESIEETPSE